MFATMKIRSQLLLLSGVSLALFVLAVCIALLGLRTSQAQFRDYIERDKARLAAFNEMYAQGLQSGQALRNIMLDPANRKAYDNLDKAIADYDAALKRARAHSAERSEILARLATFEDLARQQHAARTAVLAEVSAGRLEAAQERLNKEETTAWRALKKELLDGIAGLDREAEQTEKRLADESRRGQLEIVAVALFALAVMLLTSFVILRNLLHQLGGEPTEAVRIAQRMASGDLSDSIAVSADDATSVVAAFARMQNGLRTMVCAVQRIAHELACAASELREVAALASSATDAQSKSAADIAASLDETSVLIDQVRDNASQAREMAEEAGTASHSGAKVINEVAAGIIEVASAVTTSANTISELKEYSQEISNIISVIREVAEQTNLLALNAAIEAARAGEQGRGFAVVADEVRKLAERTTESTRVITAVIEKVQSGASKAAEEVKAGVQRVKIGVDLSNRAGDSVGSIESATDRAATAIADIGKALNEQATAVQAIAHGVDEIAQIAGKNSASVRQTEVAAARLQEMAKELDASVARFRV